MRILIATGIYPPDIGGPAQYAVNMETEWKKLGHEVTVRTFRFERRLPSGVRHFWYLVKIAPAAFRADFIFILDTFSAALPAVFLGRLFGKKTIIRTGGDFLWEGYVERTGDLVLLRNFYETRMDKFSQKERLIFRIMKWALQHASFVVFSTEWQRKIWMKPYCILALKTAVIENYYGPKEVSYPPVEKNFLAGTRPLQWKNDQRLKEAFEKVKDKDKSLVYDNATTPFSVFMDKLAHSYAVILASLGDISPNLILDAIRHNKPFIVTQEVGFYDRIKGCALFVDPESVEDIAEKIEWLSDPVHYEEQKKKIEAFSFVHSWEEIADEFLELYKKL